MKTDLSRLVVAISVLALASFSAACGSSSGGGTVHPDGGDASADAPQDGSVLVTVSGFAAPHPLNAALAPSTADGGFTMINVAVVDPSTVLSNPSAPPLAGGALDTAASNCGPVSVGDAGASGDAAAPDAAVASPFMGCAWSFNDVNITNIVLGMVGILSDARTSNPVWVKTGTGAGTGTEIAAVRLSPRPITNRQLYAVSVEMEAALATFAASAIPGSNLHAGDLTTRGFMIGTITGKISEGATPVAGATVTAAAASQFDILYPNATFSGNGTSTASHGTFLAVPKLGDSGAPAPIVSTWTVTPPTGSSLTWITYTSGTQPGTAFVLLFLASE
jgi:hypothetical protein